MTINGENQEFEVLGKGIDLRENGYRLQLNLDRRNNDPYREQGVSIVLPYQKTGKNIIERFNYHQYINAVAFNGDFINGELESTVLTNTRTCFSATFSGS
ncbi:hypothetical protein [Zunongwangia sp. H14]|uniref:hypothetical protein n=1 Tax=Zunongwangia sp. H14 TaxID=3240792 RepID=UPI00356636A7